jgi:hypothetical protein
MDADGRSVVLEVGGTDDGDIGSLLTRRLRQAAQSIFARKSASAACEVRFVEPMASLQDNERPR